MIIDAHAHFEPALLTAPQLIERMNANGINKTVLIAPVTIPAMYKKSDFAMGIQRKLMRYSIFHPLLRMMDNGFHTVPGQWNPWFRSVLGKPSLFRICTEPDNEAVANIVTAHPDRLMGWVWINPKKANWSQDLTRWIAKPGMIGVKVHPFWHRYGIKQLYPVAKIMMEQNKPLLVHLGFDRLADVRQFCLDFPKLKLVIAHAAKPFYQDVWPAIKQSAVHYVDFAGHHVDQSIVTDAINFLGAKHCIFGTDDPYGEASFSLQLKQWIDESGLSAADKELILYHNFTNLINSNS